MDARTAPLARAGAIALIALLAGSAAAQNAITFRFGGVSRNDDNNTSTGEDQLTLDIFVPTPSVPGRGDDPRVVDFVFTNEGSSTSSLYGIYIDDDQFLQFFSVFNNTIINGAGVLFDSPSSPGELPGGDAINFTTDISIGAVDPQPDNGINPGESLTFRLTLLAGVDGISVIQRIQNEQFRIGLLAGGFDGGGTETFVNNPDPVPAPTALALLGAAGLCAARRRRA